MSSTRIRAVINNKEIIFTMDMPNHFTETKNVHDTRAFQLIGDRMKAMGIKDWDAGFATSAAQHDQEALTMLVRSRRSDGQDVSLAGLLSRKRSRKIKHQKYPKK